MEKEVKSQHYFEILIEGFFMFSASECFDVFFLSIKLFWQVCHLVWLQFGLENLCKVIFEEHSFWKCFFSFSSFSLFPHTGTFSAILYEYNRGFQTGVQRPPRGPQESARRSIDIIIVSFWLKIQRLITMILLFLIILFFVSLNLTKLICRKRKQNIIIET